MLDDPGLSRAALVSTLGTHYGLRVDDIHFLPLGFDAHAALYRVDLIDGDASFLKVHFAPLNEKALQVPRALVDRGVPNVLAPLPTVQHHLWAPLSAANSWTVVLYPFIQGENASEVGLTAAQWRTFGVTLRAVHRFGDEPLFTGLLHREDFALPAATRLRSLLDLMAVTSFEAAAAERLAACYRDNLLRIHAMLARAEALGRQLRVIALPAVLCHADIHAANIMVGQDGRIWLVDWDGPLLAPQERDLLFVVGSRIACTVTEPQEDCFFEGYGPATINADALRFFRYERIIEDLEEFGKSVLLNPALSDAARAAETGLAVSFFDAGGDIDRAEQVPRQHWPQDAP
jgi:spectinomycin phosphotransferase